MSAAAATLSPIGRIQSILDSLIDERRRLRAERHDAPLLEANRIAIVYWQQELDRNLAGGIAGGVADREP